MLGQRQIRAGFASKRRIHIRRCGRLSLVRHPSWRHCPVLGFRQKRTSDAPQRRAKPHQLGRANPTANGPLTECHTRLRRDRHEARVVGVSTIRRRHLHSTHSQPLIELTDLTSSTKPGVIHLTREGPTGPLQELPDRPGEA